MAKKKNNGTAGTLTPKQTGRQAAAAALTAVAGFFVLCLEASNTLKGLGLGLAVLTLGAVCLVFGKLRERMGLPMLLLAALVLMEGVSTLYADAGKFALREYLYTLIAFCTTLLLLCFAPEKSMKPERWIGGVLTGMCALVSLVSIDLISTHLISGPVLSLLGLVTPDYENLAGVEAGVRVTGLFSNGNVFAGMAGLGVLVGLGLICSAGSRRERTVHTVLLYINALGFLLAFSMGATAAIAVAFLLLLALERRERRMSLLALMLQTLLLGVLAAAVISMTALKTWTG